MNELLAPIKQLIQQVDVTAGPARGAGGSSAPSQGSAYGDAGRKVGMELAKG